MDKGSNLPDFRALQLEFTAHIRHPQKNGIPEGVEPRRMQIYRELVFNNVENFLSTTFPVTRSCFTGDDWRELVRDYLHRHKASSPYFLEIPQEFMEFLAATETPAATDSVDEASRGAPPWLLELCHYEWVELALDVADLELPWDQVDPDADAMESALIVSPLIWSLGYHWPVHTIGPENKTNVQKCSTLLIVFRDRQDKVRFMESDPPTSRFLELLGTNVSLRECIDQMNVEMPQLTTTQVEEKMLATLKNLRGADIVLGPARAVE